MSWTLSVSARKGEFPDALDRADPVHKGDLHPDAETQVEALKTFIKSVLPTYALDAGLVGLYATGGGGEASGLVSVSLSVASEAFPPEPPAPAPEPEPTPARAAASEPESKAQDASARRHARK